MTEVGAMPLYEYEPADPEASCDHCRERFEVLQAFDEAPLQACPACGSPCVKVVSAANVSTRPRDPLSPKNLAEKGFTQYRKNDDGTYRKTAGSGPDLIKR